VLQFILYIAVLLFAILPDDSSHEYQPPHALRSKYTRTHSKPLFRCKQPHSLRYQQLLADSQSAAAKQNKSSVFVAVTLAMFTGQLLYGLAVLILPQYARSNGISQSSLGLLVGSYSAASLFVSPLLSMACAQPPPPPLPEHQPPFFFIK